MSAPFELGVESEILEVHRYMDEGEAVVTFRKDKSEWVVSESSTYEPSEAMSELEEPSWVTTGEQSFFNLTRQLGLRRDIEFSNSGVQGLVYALAALRDGGRRDPQFYIDYIRDRLIPEDFEEKSRPLNELEVEGVMALFESGLRTPHLPE